MNMEEFVNFCEVMENYFKSHSKDTEKERTLSQLIKLQEEVGELSEAVLGSLGQQRETKDYGEVEKELADIVIVTGIIAANMNIDLENAIENKIKKVKERYKLN